MDSWEGEITTLYSQYAHHPESFFSWCCEELITKVPLKANMRVLDLAGGSGLFTRRLLEREPSAHVTILDASAEQLAHAGAIFGEQVQYVHATAEHYQPEQPYDIVVCANAFWYLHTSVITRIGTWLVPGGHFVFNLHERNSLFKEQSFFTKVHHEIDHLAREQYRTACLIYQGVMSVENVRKELTANNFTWEEHGERYEEPRECWHLLCELQARRTAPYMGISIEPEAKLSLYRQAYRNVLHGEPKLIRHSLFFVCKR